MTSKEKKTFKLLMEKRKKELEIEIWGLILLRSALELVQCYES